MNTSERIEIVYRILVLFDTYDGSRSGAMKDDEMLGGDMQYARKVLRGLVASLDVEQSGGNNGAVFRTTEMGRAKIPRLASLLRRTMEKMSNDSK